MKAISLWQPHAALMRSGHKTIETRPAWAMKMRRLIGSDLAICATKNTPTEEFIAAMDGDPRLAYAVIDAEFGGDRSELPIVNPAKLRGAGCVLAVVRVADVVQMVDATEPIVQHPHRYLAVSPGVLVLGTHEDARSAEHVNIEHERPFGFYAPGRVGIVTDDLRRLERPVPVTGHQQVWTLPADVEAAVRDQLGMAAETAMDDGWLL